MWQFSIISFVLLVTALLCGVAAYQAWVRRLTRSASALAGLLASNGLWAFTESMRISSMGALAQMRWLQVEWIPVLLTPLCWFVFVLTLIGYGYWFKRRRALLLLVLPILTYVLVLTNDAHHLIWSGQRLVDVGGFRIHYAEHGVLYTPIVYYLYVLMLVSLGLLLRSIWQAHGLVQRQYLLVLLGALVPIVANILSLLDPLFQYFDATVIMFLISAALYLWAIFGLKLLDVIPIARKTVIDNLPDGHLVVDRTLRVADVTRGTLRFLPNGDRSKMVGKPIGDVLPGWLYEMWNLSFQPTALRQTVKTDVDGKPGFVEVRFQPIHHPHAEGTAGWVVGLHDVTVEQQAQIERERLCERQIEIQLEKERVHLLTHFIRDAAQEFGTPLTIINSSAFLLERLSEPEKRRKKARLVQEQVQRIITLVDTLLKIVNLESGRNNSFSPVDLRALVDGICVQFSSEDKPMPTLDWARPSQPVIVHGIASHLFEAMTQVIENATHYTPPEGTITLRLICEENRVVLSVQDTGEGISDAELPYIFDAFWRKDDSRSDAGFGMGLTIARRIVRFHGGDIEVESRVGQGSTFRMVLPA